MNAVLDKNWPVKLARPQYVFICTSCGRSYNSLYCNVPDGWVANLTPDGLGHDLHCPDCNLSACIAASDLQSPDKSEPQPTDPFDLYLEKQDNGRFQIAMTPQAVLMRWYPLGFYLSPTQARAQAAELIRLAALAENPGSVPSISGGVE